MKVIAAFAGSFIFVFGYFLLIELLDRTLRSKLRTERITGGKVIGAFPGSNGLRHRGYSKVVNELTSRSLGNMLLGRLVPGRGLIVNIISLEKEEGKSHIASQLSSYYTSIGLQVNTFSWHSDFLPTSKEYLFAEKLDDITDHSEEHVALVEYPPLNESAIPAGLLQQAQVNLLIIRSTRTWKDADKILFNNLIGQAGHSPVYLVLNKTKREETEYFTGLLPPYTHVRKLIYRLSQFGLTSVD
jgi:hypothetical protein